MAKIKKLSLKRRPGYLLYIDGGVQRRATKPARPQRKNALRLKRKGLLNAKLQRQRSGNLLPAQPATGCFRICAAAAEAYMHAKRKK